MGRHSPLRSRRLTRYEQSVERFAASRAGAWLFVHAFNPVDRRLLPVTRGRLSLAVGAPVGLLHTVGARTGRPRRTPVVYLREGERVILVASNGGSARHPAWHHNARAHPDVRFLSRESGTRAYRARVATGDERVRLWSRMTDLYAGYAAYQQRAGARELPLVVLEPLPEAHAPATA
jgi:deazaflavin-dependent oxidoreductase (nitroreductase family)